MKRIFFFSFIIMGLALIGCNGGSVKKKQAGAKESAVKSAPDTTVNGPKPTNLHIYTVPAPLQMVTAMKMLHAKYNADKLVSSTMEENYASSYKKALNLGVYTTDLGYTTVYEQGQRSLNYAKNVQSLMKELQINSPYESSLVSRFKQNQERPDSLCRIILAAYKDANDYFQNSKREDVGAFILCGCYIEGLYISLNAPNMQVYERFRNMIGQQKLYLHNIEGILNYLYNQPEYTGSHAHIASLLKQLSSIENVFENINVSYDTSRKKDVISCNISKKQLNMLQTVVGSVRNQMIRT